MLLIYSTQYPCTSSWLFLLKLPLEHRLKIERLQHVQKMYWTSPGHLMYVQFKSCVQSVCESMSYTINGTEGNLFQVFITLIHHFSGYFLELWSFFFFLPVFSFMETSNSQDHRVREEAIFTPLYHFYLLANIKAFTCNFECEATIARIFQSHCYGHGP